ncbi:MAG: CRISPR-associated endonuclease Cas1, partial [Sphaerospermopsis kisseleviana]
ALPKSSRNGQLRLAQYQVYSDPVKRLDLVKTIVTAKIHNQYHVLYRHNEKDNPLKERKSLVKNQQTLDQVRGVEGLAAREYFACWQNMVGKQWTFNGRNRRPPTDPVNSLLSFAYALLQGQVMAAVNVAGLDPYIGYLHEVHHGQPAMVLDLMEEFRALIADNLVLSILNKQEIKPNDFNESLGAYRLKDNAKKTFLQAFDKKMNDEFKHPVFDYRCTYRRGIELQARLLSRHLQEGVPYKPLSLR